VPFDIERLAELVTADRNNNPSKYAVVVISEGASMIGGGIVEGGQEDAYGHKKLGGIGQLTGEELKQRTGIDILYQPLGYLMRAGAPDSLDRMVATSYANLAIASRLPAAIRPDGEPAERGLHHGAARQYHPKGEARRRGGVLRFRELLAQGGTSERQAGSSCIRY